MEIFLVFICHETYQTILYLYKIFIKFCICKQDIRYVIFLRFGNKCLSFASILSNQNIFCKRYYVITNTIKHHASLNISLLESTSYRHWRMQGKYQKGGYAARTYRWCVGRQVKETAGGQGTCCADQGFFLINFGFFRTISLAYALALASWALVNCLAVLAFHVAASVYPLAAAMVYHA